MSISMIPCDSDCIYQKDGYCILEIPTIITDLVQNGCVHRIQAQTHKSSYSTALPRIELDPLFNQLPPQMPL
ncbi:MAG: hypothetical protein HFJ84_03935 [Clostridiales bacterium]|nr:hypothetical protein [Clostridiales bacterium]